ncbi:MAG: hypothetical protein H6760_03720 [Candidatus Nomurabacteria bacterium]|nr:MAG: hypothetical protein H6760_03720 [Candidatus Nomurabacteria bacterium]
MQILPYILLFVGVFLRLIPHPLNVAPVAAIALFAGVYLRKSWAVILPLSIMMMSDILMSVPAFREALPWGLHGAGWYSLAPITWLSFAFVGLIGLWVRQKKNVLSIAGGTLLGSIVFYLVTNWAVWFFGTMYAHTFSGLIQSYTMALPFFRNTLIGDLFYTTVLFGGFESVRWFVRMKARREVPQS